MSKQKQWSSFEKNQQHTDAWREYLNEGMSNRMVKARAKDRKCLPDGGTKECPCPDAEGEQEELEWVDVDASQATETITSLQGLNRGLQLNLDDGAVMREYQQFLRDQRIKIMDQGKELDLSEAWNPFSSKKKRLGSMEHEEGRAPKLGKLENLEKYPNLYKIVTAALQSEKYKQDLLDVFMAAGFADVKEFAAANAQEQPAAEEQPEEEEEAPAEEQPEEQPEEEPEEQPEEQPEEEPEEQPEAPAEEPSPAAPVPPGGEGGEERQPAMVVGDDKPGYVQAPKVQAHLKKAMGQKYDEKKVKLVLQALARVNKNPEIQFPEEMQENMDLAAAAKMLKNSGIDETFIKHVVVAMLKTAGLKVADFNQAGRSITGKDQQQPRTAVKKGDTYEYTSGKGTKAVVTVTDPLQKSPQYAQVAQVNQDTCKPMSNRVFAAPIKKLTDPADKCTPQQLDTGESEEEEKQYEIGKGPPGVMGTPPSAQWGRNAAAAQAESLDKKDEILLEKWQKLAGIIKG